MPADAESVIEEGPVLLRSTIVVEAAEKEGGRRRGEGGSGGKLGGEDGGALSYGPSGGGGGGESAVGTVKLTSRKDCIFIVSLRRKMPVRQMAMYEFCQPCVSQAAPCL